MLQVPKVLCSGTITITGRNQYGEIVSETVSDEILNSPFVQGLAAITREKYASIGIDLDEALRKMVREGNN